MVTSSQIGRYKCFKRTSCLHLEVTVKAMREEKSIGTQKTGAANRLKGDSAPTHIPRFLSFPFFPTPAPSSSILKMMEAAGYFEKLVPFHHKHGVTSEEIVICISCLERHVLIFYLL